jgi:hypothetical protein
MHASGKFFILSFTLDP